MSRVIKRRGAYKGIVINKGYLAVYMPSHPNAVGTKKLYYPLHRLIAEWKLGRKLTKDEVVHHMDDDTLNNHPDNLEVLTASDHNKLTISNRKRDKYGKVT